jgi:hypothetical protein
VSEQVSIHSHGLFQLTPLLVPISGQRLRLIIDYLHWLDYMMRWLDCLYKFYFDRSVLPRVAALLTLAPSSRLRHLSDDVTFLVQVAVPVQGRP